MMFVEPTDPREVSFSSGWKAFCSVFPRGTKAAGCAATAVLPLRLGVVVRASYGTVLFYLEV